MTAVHGVVNGRALYVGDAPMDVVHGDFELSTGDGRTIGVYAPSKWILEDDAISPIVRPGPQSGSSTLTRGTFDRIQELLGASTAKSGR
jgi:hypothetical protein